MDTLVVETQGRSVECEITWNAGGTHIVARPLDDPRRLIIAKRKLGAWREVPPSEVAAKLDRAETLTVNGD